MGKLNPTSSPISVSQFVEQGTANAFEVFPVDLQLNALDQEVFVVTGVKIDFVGGMPAFVGTVSALPECQVAVTTTRPTTMPNLGNSNCIAFSQLSGYVGTDAGGIVQGATMIEQSSTDTPPANMDYIGIIATSDFFISIDSNAWGAPAGSTQDVAVRVYGYRAKADASTYAALVQSEVLSD